MRGSRSRKLTVLGAALAVSLLGALIAGGQSSAQYPPYPTTSTPTTPSTPSTPSSGSTPSGSHSVTIGGTTTANYAFQPHKLSVKKGTTVKWNWSSNAPHNVTFTKLQKHSKTGASETFQVKFKHTGTFRYKCTVHGFGAKIVVH